LVRGFLVFGRSREATNFLTFLKFGIAKKSYICVIFEKDYGWPRKLGGQPGAKLGASTHPDPGLKPPLV